MAINNSKGRPKLYFTKEAAAEARRNQQRERRREMVKQGLCIYQCGEPHRPGMQTCQSCADYLKFQKATVCR